MKQIGTVAIIGLGAIGAFFADSLLPALNDGLRIIAGGERAKALKEEGMVINGTREFYNVVAPDEKTEPADLVIITTKMTELKQALEDIKNQVGPDTIIMAPLNGVESEGVVAEKYGWDKVLYSLMRVSSVKDGNKVSFDPDNSFLEFGERTNDLEKLSDKVKTVQGIFEEAGIKYQIRPDMNRAIWEKYVCNVSENQVAAILDIPFGAWGSCNDANQLRLMVADEVIQIARKKGIMIDPDYAKDHLEFLKVVPEKNKPSTLQDILAGRKTEKDMLAGTVIRLGKETGVQTPLNEFLYHAIKVLEDKNDGKVKGVN